MTARGFYTLLFGALMLLTALSVGSAGAFLLGTAALFCWALSFLCVLLAVLGCRVTQETALRETERGGACRYQLSVRLLLPAPIAPLSLRVSLPSGRQSEFLLPARLMGQTSSENEFPCPHVGVFPVGVTQIAFADCFGLFSLRCRARAPLAELTVLPKPADVQPLAFSPGEGESSAAQRAQADHSTPADVRAWQDGDELKRVHWKLSARRQSLMVHTYETPQRPDALVILNCAPPPAVGPAQRAALIDALEETCAGTLRALLAHERLTHLPLSGETQRELSGQNAEALPGMLRALAQERFARAADFSRVLWLSARRTRRTGSIAIVSAELTPAIADAAIALSRMGPHTRFTLVTCAAPDDAQRSLLHLLAASGLETAHVKA